MLNRVGSCATLDGKACGPGDDICYSVLVYQLRCAAPRSHNKSKTTINYVRI